MLYCIFFSNAFVFYDSLLCLCMRSCVIVFVHVVLAFICMRLCLRLYVILFVFVFVGVTTNVFLGPVGEADFGLRRSRFTTSLRGTGRLTRGTTAIWDWCDAVTSPTLLQQKFGRYESMYAHWWETASLCGSNQKRPKDAEHAPVCCVSPDR